MANDIQIYLNNFFDEYGFSDKKIGVALSGGRDSVALAYALKKGGYDVVAINVEHGIRGENSLKDSAFVRDFCQKYDIVLYQERVDSLSFARDNGYTVEQSARILRYRVFENALEKGVCDVVALAHHQDDQAETLLMRIIRGTGVNGLCGMRAVRGKYIRPLLDCSREEIDEYVAQNGIDYVDDETNFCTDYTRNYLRAELAELKKRFPSICRNMARLSQNAVEEEDFVNEFIPSVEAKDGEVRLNVCDLENDFVAKRLIVKAVNALGVTQDIESRHFPLVLALKGAQNGKMIELTHGICVHKDLDALVFTKDENLVKTSQTQFEVHDFDNFGASVQRSDREEYEAQKGKGALFVDGDKIGPNAVLRYRKDGDFIEKFGGGRKSLGDFLTDKKIPLRKRDTLVLLASGDEVLAVFGVEISKKVAIDDNTKNILKLTKK